MSIEMFVKRLLLEPELCNSDTLLERARAIKHCVENGQSFEGLLGEIIPQIQYRTQYFREKGSFQKAGAYFKAGQAYGSLAKLNPSLQERLAQTAYDITLIACNMPETRPKALEDFLHLLCDDDAFVEPVEH